MTDEQLIALLGDTVDAIAAALGGLDDWGPAGTTAGQYHSDLAADAAAHEVLGRAGVGVLSEESGLHRGDSDVVVVIDPLDGSTNASRGIPWFASSLCAVDADGPLAALVVNLVTNDRFEAIRGGGARVDGRTFSPSGCTDLHADLNGLSGYPSIPLGWKQYRALGAAALDLCAVAAGVLDGYVDCSWNAHGVWDYLGALLVCREAGVVVKDLDDRELVVLEPSARRTPVAAATPALFEQLIAARRALSDTSASL